MAVAPTAAAFAAAQPVADRRHWTATGADARAVWGRCRGSGREPYETVVDHVGLGWRCSCPSRRAPCKHALALLVLWVRGEIDDGVAPPPVETWLDRRAATADRTAGSPGPTSGAGPGAATGPGSATGPGDGTEPDRDRDDGDVDGPPGPPDRSLERDDRVARMRAGLIELDRWVHDRVRTGLTDPALARYSTWDELAARLVDARAGSLANRVRRLAGLVGASPDWHDRVLAELGVLHLLAQAGLRLGDLPDPLADAVATTTGWQVRRADVLAGVPDTDDWVVAGRSDTREDRIEVRRHWLWGRTSGRWAMSLSFAAYGQTLDDSLEVGTVVHADVFRYPGGALRAIVGPTTGDPGRPAAPLAVDMVTACDQIGRAVAAEPWLERLAVTVSASPTVVDGRWVLTDHTGSLPLLGSRASLATVLAASSGADVAITAEWTPGGLLPLTVHLSDRSLDVGPLVDASFVGAR